MKGLLAFIFFSPPLPFEVTITCLAQVVWLLREPHIFTFHSLGKLRGKINRNLLAKMGLEVRICLFVKGLVYAFLSSKISQGELARAWKHVLFLKFVHLPIQTASS